MLSRTIDDKKENITGTLKCNRISQFFGNLKGLKLHQMTNDILIKPRSYVVESNNFIEEIILRNVINSNEIFESERAIIEKIGNKFL